MALSKNQDEKELLLKRGSIIAPTDKAQNNTSEALMVEIECDAECDDDPETIRLTTDACGETFPHRRLSSVSSEDAFSDYSASNTTSSSEESDIGSITNGRSKLRFWTSMITFTISSLLGGVAVSMLVPFYTKEAEDKGVSVSQAGLVFGSVNFVQILFIPLFGKYLNKLKAHRLFVNGVFICGAANIAFGFLQWVKGPTFLALSFVIRIVSAIGEAAFLTSLYPLATKTTTERYRSTILSVMETSFGVGMTTGPALGGILYDYKGFFFPFVIVGGVLIGCSFISALIIEKEQSEFTDEEDNISIEDGKRTYNKRADTTFSQLFSTAAITVPFIILVLSEMSVSWFVPTLEPFLSENFSLDSTLTGIMFSLEGLTYAAFSPLFGILLDRGMSPYLTMSFGVVCQILGLSLLGPARYFNFIPKSPYTTGAGLFILGTGIAASFIVTLTYMLAEASKAHKEIFDTEQTRGMITSLWLIAENIGGWLGSFLGGVAYDSLGFEGGSLVIIGLQGIIVMGIPYVWYRTNICRQRKLKDMLSNKCPFPTQKSVPKNYGTIE